MDDKRLRGSLERRSDPRAALRRNRPGRLSGPLPSGRVGFGRDRARSPRMLIGGLLAASVVLMGVDAAAGSSSPVESVRGVVADVVGPVESAATAATRPVRETFGYLRANRELRTDVARLSAQNDQLRSRADQVPLDRQRLAELDGLTRASMQTGHALVAARVVGMGPLQSFSRTVTLDAGSSSGIGKDMTVLNSQGLVGRVIAVTRSTATVLLVVDTDSVVGGRLGSNLEIGFLRGRGITGQRGRLDLDLVDNSVTPAKDDLVVTWGSQNGVPYVPGVPIGTVESVYSTPRELAKHAIIKPLVNFTSLDVVGVVVPQNTRGDRPVIRPNDPTGQHAQGANR